MHTPPPVRPSLQTFDKASFLQASRVVLPMVLGSLPFALITGAITVNAGISPFNSFLMSFFISAGASQIAAVNLIVAQAPLLIVILTGLVINLRLVMYSASIAPYLTEASPWKKLLISFMLTDQAYAVSLMEFNRPDSNANRVSYYLGAATTVIVIWMMGIVAGIFLGNSIPPSWSFDFAVPLTFLLLLITVLKDKPSLLAAGTSGFIAVGTSGVPYNLNIILGAAAGILAGFWAEKSAKKQRHEHS